MRHWTDIVTTAPAVEPVCVDEVKSFAEIEHSDDDALLASYITAARQWVEEYCSRALVTQTRALRNDCFPSMNFIDEFRAPLATVVSVTYTDTAGVSQVLTSAAYQVDITSTPGRLGLNTGYSWPATKDNTFNAVIIAYTAGQAVADVPAALKQAVLRIVGGMWNGCSAEQAADTGVLALLSDYRVRWYA